MYTKRDVKPDDIKANIYNNIHFIVDIQGASTEGLENSDSDISTLFDSNEFNRMEDTFTYDELNEWDKRNHRIISNKMKQRMIETEKVIRYISKDETEQILLSKNYMEMRLLYRKSFILKDKMDLLQKIVRKYAVNNPFLQIDNVTLIKNNSIICKSLPMLYRCFDIRHFGDIKSGLTYQGALFAEYNSSAAIVMDKYNLIVQKEINAGTLGRKLSYMGNLNFIINYPNNNSVDSLDIKAVLKDMNGCLFNVFVNHLTVSFLNDLTNGETTKVLRGFKKNE